MYNDTVLDHLSNPRNVGIVENADGIGHVGNPADGDKITITIEVKNNIISDIKLKVFGCGAAIASGSMLTELALGKPIEDALKISNEDVSEALGGLPPQKLQCSNIAATALHNAITDYKSRYKQHF
jgi:nitrogen fixation NifU-like protein